jgi:hypothetical protein
VNKKKQKTLLIWGMGVGSATAHGPESKKFFGSFFKKELLPSQLFPAR